MEVIGRNRIEWPFMSETDDYLDARNAAEKTAVRLCALKADLEAFVLLLDASPHKVRVPPTWLDKEAIQVLVNEACEAFDVMRARWDRLPTNRQEQLPRLLQTLKVVGQPIPE